MAETAPQFQNRWIYFRSPGVAAPEKWQSQLFLGSKKVKKKKSYVLGMDPFDEVYKGDCLTLRGQNAPFPRYKIFFLTQKKILISLRGDPSTL